jgi:inhibitor of KinA sporulation pathway (predicted exonuclease)
MKTVKVLPQEIKKMNLVFLDLEFSQFVDNGKVHFDIIEIGAVKINESFEVIDKFQSFISPRFKHKFNFKIQKLMNVKFKDINNAPNFLKVITIFESWIENSVVYTWGDDAEIIFSNYKERKMYNNIQWMFDIIDLQEKFSKIYFRIFKNGKVGLVKALKYYKIPIEKSFHRALNDAEFLAIIYLEMNKRLGLKNIIYMNSK